MIRRNGILLSFLFLSLSTSLVAADIEGEVRTGVAPGLDHVAIVQLLDGSRVIKETYTDLNGRFAFTQVSSKPYRIRVSYTGFPEMEVPVALAAGAKPTKVSITLKPSESGAASAEAIASDERNIPKSAKKEFEKGLEARKKQNCDKALPHFLKAISLYDRYGSAYNELGQCKRQQGDFTEAETYLRRAVQHSSDIAFSVNLANLYIGGSRLEEAEQVLQNAIRFHPTEGDLFYALARVNLDQGKTREAETAAMEAHSRTHKSADVHLLLARIYLEAKNYPALATQLETYLIENPNGPAASQVRSGLSQLQPENQ